MKRLQTYFALIAAIFGIAGAVFGYVAHAIIPDNPLLFAWIILVCGILSLALSLIIGHFIADPLDVLHRKVRAHINGDTRITIQPEGKLYEADLLAEDLAELIDFSRSKLSDLQARQEREAGLLGDVAHELRTPLASIRGNAEILLDPDMPREMHDNFCQTIIDQSDRLTRLTNNLVTLQHIESGDSQRMLSRINLRELAESVVFSMTSIINDRGANVEVVGEAPDVLGNKDHLIQVIHNLLSNALRFVGEDGHIVIKLEGLAGQSIIVVTDNGPGFGKTDPNKLFDRFYRGDNSRARNTGGAGLGLSIVKSIVDQHDGTIEAINTAEGACFIVALPSVRVPSF